MIVVMMLNQEKKDNKRHQIVCCLFYLNIFQSIKMLFQFGIGIFVFGLLLFC